MNAFNHLSLTFKWMITLLITSLVGIALVGAFALYATNNAFDQLKINEAQTEFTQAAENAYLVNGSWENITFGTAETAETNAFTIRPGQPNRPNSPGRGQGAGLPRPEQRQPGNPMPPQFILVDNDEQVVWPGGPYQIGDQVSRREFNTGKVIEVEEEVVGRVIFLGGAPQLNANDQRYLETTTQALMIGAAGAGTLALIMGVVLAGHFTRPLRELTTAIRAMRGGNLAQQVEVRTRDELGELTEAFNQMSAELHKANQLRRQMTADIAHDLRTPLTIISGYLEGLRDGTLQPTPERLNTMFNETTQLKHLIEDLRTLSLADAGELPLRTQMVSPNALIRDVAASFAGLAEDHAIALVVQEAESLPNVAIDPDRMTQVFANLVSNAIRHTPAAGTITLSVQSAPRGRTTPPGVTFTVADTGEGIPAETLPYIFERFYRSDGSRHQTAGETGLGLAIARSIVVAHGGSIHAESTVGQGTHMIIVLPAQTRM